MSFFHNYKKTVLAIIILVVLVVIIIFSGKKSKEKTPAPVEIDYTPVVHEPLRGSLELADIEEDVNVKLDFPTADFKL